MTRSQWQIDQGKACGCRGVDDMCPCQNTDRSLPMTAAQEPRAGDVLTAESVKLLRTGDLLRIDTGGYVHRFVRRKIGERLIVTEHSGRERYYAPFRFTFVSRPSESSASVGGEDWRPMRTAPKDGSEIETLCVHPTAHYSTDAFGEGWAAIVRAKWIDHNGGGWTWSGLAGVHMAWRPLRTQAPAREGEGLALKVYRHLTNYAEACSSRRQSIEQVRDEAFAALSRQHQEGEGRE